MYVELDHGLVPRMLEDINEKTDLSGRKKKGTKGLVGESNLVNKYEVKRGNIQDVFLAFEINKLDKNEKYKADKKQFPNSLGDKKEDKEETKKIDVKLCEAVIGPFEEVFYDEDFGFFSAILACYNNHWVLKTSPDDWWNVIVRIVAQAVDENGNKKRVSNLFVDHEGQKEISVIVPNLATIDYSWLFNQFSKGLRQNIKTPGYVDVMEADFTTTAPHQLISSQVMLMSSLQKYFSYSFGTCCGIPGVEMKGTLEDWEKLTEKLQSVEKLLLPVMEDIELTKWFQSTKIILGKLLNTYKGSPDKEWWGHILSWNQIYGSGKLHFRDFFKFHFTDCCLGARAWWSGWMIDFLKAGEAETPSHFQSGSVSVPIHIFENGGPKDDGLLVAGTVGYTVEDNQGEMASHAPLLQWWRQSKDGSFYFPFSLLSNLILQGGKGIAGPPSSSSPPPLRASSPCSMQRRSCKT
jgi:hypothetical protein